VGHGAGYGVHPVIVGERAAVFGEVGELVEEGVVAILGGRVLAQEALTDYQAGLQGVNDPGLLLTLGPLALLDGGVRRSSALRAADSSSDRSKGHDPEMVALTVRAESELDS
jgi:hypothetical protein